MINKLREMLEVNQSQKNLIAILLLGSVSFQVQDERSDVDLTVIYDEERPTIIAPNAPWKWDIAYMSKEEFLNLDEADWRLNAFLSAKVLIDNTDWVENHIKKVITIPNSNIKNRTAGSLDGYLNGFYRSMKAARRNNHLGALLEASTSIKYLIATLYNLNGLISPYEDRVLATIDRLSNLPIDKDQLCKHFEQILQTADPVSQSNLFRILEKYFRVLEFGNVYDAWGNDLINELLNA